MAYISLGSAADGDSVASGIARARRVQAGWRYTAFLAAALCSFPAAADDAASAAPSVEQLGQLSVEELANLEITSVSRKPQPLSQAPAAIYVITNDDVRRTGANSLPEALRLAPNLDVARVNASTYAITARGLNQPTGTANKLLVLIDGRTIYSTLFSGVFWDSQNVLLDDLDRIEVISGPGGTLWGANAVNGVINIVSRSSADTQGALVDMREGFVDRSAGVRYGGKLGDTLTYRIYAMGFERGNTQRPHGPDARDSWDNAQGGFRFDWNGAANTITFQGDLYHGEFEDLPHEQDQGAIGGGNVLGRWSRNFGDGSVLTTQAYYDKAWRDATTGVGANVETYDFDTQYGFTAGQTHSLVVGGGYRAVRDSYEPGPGTSFLTPSSRTLEFANVFGQDSVPLTSDLRLTFGLKLENNSYTGLEYMPDARLAWQVSDTALLWAAVSRAVRTPARVDRDLYVAGLLDGGRDFESEKVIAYEAGYRGQPLSQLTLSVSAFYNVYTDLRSVEASSPVTYPLIVRNGMEGTGYGIEAWGTYAVASWWRLSAGISTLHKDLHFKPGSDDVLGLAYAGNDPDYRWQLRSSMNFGPDVEFDIFVRHVDSLPDPLVQSYTDINARLGWHITPSLELALVGADLNDPTHVEFSSPTLKPREINRSLYVSAVWTP